MADERCELSDLLVSQCAHCLGHKLEGLVICRAGYPFPAAYPGRCALCLGPIEEGDQITRIREYNGGPVEGYAHARCEP